MKKDCCQIIAHELREVNSRSKAKLLNKAACAIEELLAEMEDLQDRHDKLVSFELAESKQLQILKEERDALVHALHCGAVDCDLCIHNTLEHCTEESPDCESCRNGCVCSVCSEEKLNFKWNGTRYVSPLKKKEENK